MGESKSANVWKIVLVVLIAVLAIAGIVAGIFFATAKKEKELTFENFGQTVTIEIPDIDEENSAGIQNIVYIDGTKYLIVSVGGHGGHAYDAVYKLENEKISEVARANEIRYFESSGFVFEKDGMRYLSTSADLSAESELVEANSVHSLRNGIMCYTYGESNKLAIYDTKKKESRDICSESVSNVICATDKKVVYNTSSDINKLTVYDVKSGKTSEITVEPDGNRTISSKGAIANGHLYVVASGYLRNQKSTVLSIDLSRKTVKSIEFPDADTDYAGVRVKSNICVSDGVLVFVSELFDSGTNSLGCKVCTLDTSKNRIKMYGTPSNFDSDYVQTVRNGLIYEAEVKVEQVHEVTFAEAKYS